VPFPAASLSSEAGTPIASKHLFRCRGLATSRLDPLWAASSVRQVDLCTRPGRRGKSQVAEPASRRQLRFMGGCSRSMLLKSLLQHPHVGIGMMSRKQIFLAEPPTCFLERDIQADVAELDLGTANCRTGLGRGRCECGKAWRRGRRNRDWYGNSPVQVGQRAPAAALWIVRQHCASEMLCAQMVPQAPR